MGQGGHKHSGRRPVAVANSRLTSVNTKAPLVCTPFSPLCASIVAALTLASASWLSEITGVDINVPAGTISISNPKPEAIPEMLKNLPADVLEFAINCLLTKGVCPGVWMATMVRQAKAQVQGIAQPIPNYIRPLLVNFFPAYILDTLHG